MRNQSGGREPFTFIKSMCDEMEPDRMKTRVTEEHLHHVFRCGVSVLNCSDIFVEATHHLSILALPKINSNLKSDEMTMAKG
jgi:hypothetical protein